MKPDDIIDTTARPLTLEDIQAAWDDLPRNAAIHNNALAAALAEQERNVRFAIAARDAADGVLETTLPPAMRTHRQWPTSLSAVRAARAQIEAVNVVRKDLLVDNAMRRFEEWRCMVCGAPLFGITLCSGSCWFARAAWRLAAPYQRDEAATEAVARFLRSAAPPRAFDAARLPWRIPEPLHAYRADEIKPMTHMDAPPSLVVAMEEALRASVLPVGALVCDSLDGTMRVVTFRDRLPGRKKARRHHAIALRRFLRARRAFLAAARRHCGLGATSPGERRRLHRAWQHLGAARASCDRAFEELQAIDSMLRHDRLGRRKRRAR